MTRNLEYKMPSVDPAPELVTDTPGVDGFPTDYSSGIMGGAKPDDNADVTQAELDLGANIDKAKANGYTLIEGGYINTDILEIDYALVVGTKPPSDADNTQAQLDGGADISDAKANGYTLIQGGYINTGVLLVDTAQIENAAITDAKVGDMSVDKLTAGNLNVEMNLTTGGAVKSDNFATGSTGWKIDNDGSAEFQDVTVRGQLETGSGSNIQWTYVTGISVETAHINNGAITNAKIQNLAVDNAKIDDMSADKLTAGTIDASIITVTNLDADNINSGSIDASQISVTNIDADNITTGQLSGIDFDVSNTIDIWDGATNVLRINNNAFIARENKAFAAEGSTSGVYTQFYTSGTNGIIEITNNSSGTFGIKDDNSSEYLFKCSYYDIQAFRSFLPDSSGTRDLGSSSLKWDDVLCYALKGPTSQIWLDQSGRAQVTNHFDPTGTGTYNLGGSSRYWNEVHYVSLQSHSLVDYSDGVEMQDGKKVKNLDAVANIKPSKELQKDGDTYLDKKSFPKKVYTPAPVAEEDIYEEVKDEETKKRTKVLKYKKGEKIGEDSVNETKLMSCVIGALKEVNELILELDKRIEKLENLK